MLNPVLAEFTLFSMSHGTLIRIDHIMGDNQDSTNFKEWSHIEYVMCPHWN